MKRALFALAIAVNGLFLGCSGSEETSSVVSEEFQTIIEDGSYRTWKSESKVHPSTGPHGGNVRTYVNDSLFASLSAGNAEHPKGSIAVKELYGAGTEKVTGHAVMQKTSDASNGGAGWYWYEDLGGGAIEGQGKSLCVNCHRGSTRDFVLAPFPLQ
jgi:hypothetical protein